MRRYFQRYRKNLQYDDCHVYSYDTKVAEIYPDHILQLGWWSSTTQKHINYASSQLGLPIKTPLDPNLPFMQDLQKSIQVNKGSMPIGIWNLLVSIRDVSLYTKGIKPHRNWKITEVKKYFGAKGSPQSELDHLLEIKSGYETAKEQAK